ncbi:ABC transporter ATP-binding protein [Clostridium sp. YIM B02505]|uniref:ABC transporter ATP-binding protein n=1 Tax=Clostridium yunnanense TaxID=2800325 RepID=A0ABS1EMX4_9CLOT|nr:ABC transporter ATP-binding protein [Clostridium yunnanense]MBK1810694.1 ABC transporter ATP-binding protein [Clostridium yunnanense]
MKFAKKIMPMIVTSVNSIIFCMKISWQASKGFTALRIVLEIASSVVPFINIYLGKEILDLLVKLVSGGGETASVDGFIRLIIQLTAVQACSKVMEKIKEFSSGLHNDYITNHVNVLIGKKSISLDLCFFDSTKYYDEITNANRDSMFVQMYIWSIMQGISSVFKLVTCFILLCNLNVIFAILLIFAIIPSMIIEKKYTEKVYNWQRDTVPEERKFRYILNIFSNRMFAKDMRIYNLGDEMISKYKKSWAKWFAGKKNIISKKAFLVCVVSTLPEICYAGMMYYVGSNIIRGKLTIGDYNLYTGYFGEMIGALFMLVYTFSRILDETLRIDNFRKFLAWENTILDLGEKKVDKSFFVEFRNVAFKYPNSDSFILKNLSFTIDSKDKTALVGINGAGKSTIIKLMLRFYEATEGEILINGINIKEYELESLRSRFSVMFQDYANYAFTVKENIVFSDLKNKDDESKIKDACKKSGFDSVVNKFDTGLNTFLTREFEEDGQELSGGQWQKLAIARTFFKDGDVIILDEPSAALDAESEHHVFKMFAELCKGKGAIFISHRLSNVVMADKIIVLDDGKVVESGSHSSLIKLKGKYAYLFNLQAEKYIS